MRRNANTVRELVEEVRSPEEVREEELLQISTEAYKFMLGIERANEVPDPRKIQNVFSAQRRMVQDPRFSYFDPTDVEHTMARDDGLAYAITRLGSGIWHQAEEDFLKSWHPRSPRVAQKSATQLLSTYHYESSNDRARARMLRRFGDMSTASSADRNVIVAPKLQPFQELVTRTLDDLSGHEQAERMHQLRAIASEKLGRSIVLVDTPVEQEVVAPVEIAPEPQPEAARGPRIDSEKRARWGKRAKRTLLVTGAASAGVASFGGPAAAAPMSHVLLVENSPVADNLAKGVVLPGSIFGGSIDTSVATSVAAPQASEVNSYPVAAPQPVSLTPNISVATPATSTEAPVSTPDSAPVDSGIFLQNSIETDVTPDASASSKLTSADIHRLASGSSSLLQSAVEAQLAKSGVEAMPSGPNTFGTITDGYINTADSKIQSNNAETNLARFIAHSAAHSPQMIEAMKQDPVLSAMLTDLLSKAGANYSVVTAQGMDDYLQQFKLDAPTDYGSYSDSTKNLVAASLAILDVAGQDTSSDTSTPGITTKPISTTLNIDIAVPAAHRPHTAPHHAAPHHAKHHPHAASHETTHAPDTLYNTGRFRKTWEFFANDPDLRLSQPGVAALMGNFAVETGDTMNPRVVQGFSYSDNLPDSILGKLGYGLNQATSIDRQLHLKKVGDRMGLPDGTLKVEHQFIKEELMGYPGLLAELRQDHPHSIGHMAISVSTEYERPGKPALSERVRRAKLIYEANVSHRAATPHHHKAHKSGGGGGGEVHASSPVAQRIVHQAVAALEAWPNGASDNGNTNPLIYPYTQGRHEAWCSDLASTTLRRANVDVPILPLVSNLYNHMVDSKKFMVITKTSINSGHGTVKPGDTIFYNFSGSMSALQHAGRNNHVGLVYKVKPNGDIISIDGNWDDGVRLHYTSKHDSAFMAVGRVIDHSAHASHPASHTAPVISHAQKHESKVTPAINISPNNGKGHEKKKPVVANLGSAAMTYAQPVVAPVSTDFAGGIDTAPATPSYSSDTSQAAISTPEITSTSTLDTSVDTSAPSTTVTTDAPGNSDHADNGNSQGNGSENGNGNDNGGGHGVHGFLSSLWG